LPLHFPTSEKIRKKFPKTLGLSETLCGKIAVLLRKKFPPRHAFRRYLGKPNYNKNRTGTKQFFGERMNYRKEKTVITVETLRRTVVYSRRRTFMVRCNKCAAEVQMLAPERAAALLNTTVREIFRRVERNEIHFWEADDGGLLVCRNSLEVLTKK